MPLLDPKDDREEPETETDSFEEAVKFYESESYRDELDRNTAEDLLMLPSLYAREDYIEFLFSTDNAEPLPEGTNGAFCLLEATASAYPQPLISQILCASPFTSAYRR